MARSVSESGGSRINFWETAMTKTAGERSWFTILGWVATVTAMAMYVSYIPQISNNLHGMKGNWLQPLVAACNCTLWVVYGLTKQPKRDWPIAIANSPGIVFGLATFVTAL
ncbi:hypothetical protein [Kerstersia gyiorum]|nr:hypothetical protein [Kerstersia gyiorum]MCP1670906.1 hypothetical protein [Kerstersia gyiorum]MCP1682237.1 hypothetical protein [Kerstersia gyiorum]MCP1708752.1 hypothetical protein [Kerstersia gyiorum]MCP1711650.1 hypothetical protein [Kerstersia gyiorum]MCW2187120.1 hypothetical protein [Kerstersia gyiorum]